MKGYRITTRGRTVIISAAILMIFTTFGIVKGKNIENSQTRSQNTVLIKDIIYDKKIIDNTKPIMKVNFDINSGRINPSNYKSLELLVNILKIYNNVNLEIRGYCSKEPNIENEAFNKSLSIMRAEEIKKYLVLKGISPSRIRIDGYGYSDPIENNSTKLGREMNRRAEIYIKVVL